MTEPLLIGKGEHELSILPRMANRHGMIAGATGTGKTVSLQVIAESFSKIGVPVFMADVKGDLAGISQAGTAKDFIVKRIDKMGLGDFAFEGSPVVFWDVFGEYGHPVRTTVSEMGPLLLGRLLDLNETQTGVLTMVFRIADDDGLLLLDLKDLRSMLQYVGDNAAEFKTEYGNVTSATVGAIQRGLLALEDQGGDLLFGEPALSLADLIRVQDDRGVVNILDARKLFHSPKLYATFLLWLLSELFEQLPEVGDAEKPKLVFFFDEAHLLFDDAPKALVEKVEQVVRLIRSKGVGLYFVSQNPIDIPDEVLGQLGHRVQHALRAFTPKDQQAIQKSAQTFRQNPKIDIPSAITEMGVGEALVSFLQEDGSPGIVDRALIRPPHSQIGPITDDQRKFLVQSSPMAGRYDAVADRESAHEMLLAKAEAAAAAADKAEATEAAAQKAKKPAKTRSREGIVEAVTKSTLRSVGSQMGRSITRGILGSMFRK